MLCAQVDVSLSCRGFVFKPAADKVARWLRNVSMALKEQHLSPGAASKLAHRLSWGGSHLFKRLGRALLRLAVVCVSCIS